MSLFDTAAETPYSDRDALKDKYVPDKIVGREQEKKEYVNSLKPVINGFSPDNVFLVGPSGVGKTALTRHVTTDLKQQTSGDSLSIKRVNCDGMSGETTLMLEIANLWRDPDDKLATTGYKTARARDLMFQELNRVGGTILIALDEIDTVDELDTFLYQVPRAHETGKLDPDVDVGLIGISNDPGFLDELPDDVQNTLADVTINFSEYGADELREVLSQRAALAFKDTKVTTNANGVTEVKSGVLSEEVVPLAAAFATKNTGDARMGISLLRAAGDLARDNGETTVTREHMEQALTVHEREKIAGSLERLEITAKVVLYAMVSLSAEHGSDEPPRSRAVSERYQQFHRRMGEPVSARQVRKHLSKLDAIGVTEKVEQRGGGSGTFAVHRLNYAPDVILSAIPDVVESVGVVESVQNLASVKAD